MRPIDLAMSLVRMAQGNPGAIAAIMQCCEYSVGDASVALARMDKFGVRGPELYMLWNDCCNRNTPNAIKVMMYDSGASICEHINGDGCRGTPYTSIEIGGLFYAGNQGK